MVSLKRRKLVCGAVASIVGAFVVLDAMLAPRERDENELRPRMDWEKRMDSLTEREFARRYRISKRAFRRLEMKIFPYMARQRPIIAQEAPVPTDLCLSMTLRWLAGGSFLDIIDMHGVGRATFRAFIRG